MRHYVVALIMSSPGLFTLNLTAHNGILKPQFTFRFAFSGSGLNGSAELFNNMLCKISVMECTFHCLIKQIVLQIHSSYLSPLFLAVCSVLKY